MGKISVEDKMRIQTMRELGMGAKAMKSAYPEKNWSLNTLQSMCRRIDATGSAVHRQVGSGRPRTAGTLIEEYLNSSSFQDMLTSSPSLPSPVHASFVS